MKSQRGSALVTVLWIVLVISVIAFTLAAAVRAEVRSEMDSYDSERAFFMAKGAAEAAFNLYLKRADIPENAPVRKEANGELVFPFESGEARVHFESDSGLVDLNAAPDKVMASVLDSLGVGEENRNRIIDSMLDWRDGDDIPHLYGAEVGDYPENTAIRRFLPKNAPFESVDELMSVKNITPEILFGSVTFDSGTQRYVRQPGFRDLVTVNSKSERIDANEAPFNVLKALPGISPELAQRIVAERRTKRFKDAGDLAQRVPEADPSRAGQSLTIGPEIPTRVVATGTITGSRVSRTVRLLLKRTERVQFISVAPLIYRKVSESKFDRWQF